MLHYVLHDRLYISVRNKRYFERNDRLVRVLTPSLKTIKIMKTKLQKTVSYTADTGRFFPKNWALI